MEIFFVKMREVLHDFLWFKLFSFSFVMNNSAFISKINLILISCFK